MNWQPIETAPEDGEWILVYSDHYVFCPFDVVHYDYGAWTNSGGGFAEPTHWVPLPDPPKETQ